MTIFEVLLWSVNMTGISQMDGVRGARATISEAFGCGHVFGL